MYKHSFDQADITECDINVTFQNPYLSEKFECDSCGFVTTDKKEFELHLDDVKNWCSVCKEDFNCVDYMKEHLDADH